MRDLPYLVIAAFLLLWGIVTAAQSPLKNQSDSVAPPLSLQEDEYEDLPPDVAEMPEVAPTDWPWPDYLVYPRWTVLTVSEPTVCSSSDSLFDVKQWYWQHLPQASLVEFTPGEHVSIVNEEIEVELESTAGGTNIRIKARPKRH
jgi:hypothetical protein